jgi:hypothetical protein
LELQDDPQWTRDGSRWCSDIHRVRLEHYGGGTVRMTWELAMRVDYDPNEGEPRGMEIRVTEL